MIQTRWKQDSGRSENEGNTDPKKMAEKNNTYYFNCEWEVEFFTTVEGACMCLICGATAKRHNVERFHNMSHKLPY